MKYFSLPVNYPVTFLSCGQLVKNKNFLHPKRCIDSYVLIYVLKGTLYISQNQHQYQVQEDHFILLHADTEHHGYQESSGYLHYYWVHFHVPEQAFFLTSEKDMEKYYSSGTTFYILPEYGFLHQNKRLSVLFSQLLDISMQNPHVIRYQLHYALTALLMELSNESFTFTEPKEEESLTIYKIQDWIRHNYQQSLTVYQIADQFHYNPDYLSNKYRKATGISLSHYLNWVRIESAKELLTTTDSPLKAIAFYCGFSDEKYFYKVFKRFEGVTPSEFRNAFYKKKEVSQ